MGTSVRCETEVVAILIPLTRVFEADDAVTYDATTSRGQVRLRLQKSDGTVEVLDAESDPEAITEFVVQRASLALRKHWESGEFPMHTDYRH
jgi:hypothetical protein